MRRRSNLLVLLGAAFFIVGSLTVYLLVDDDEGSGRSADPTKANVVVAKEDIPVGALANELIESGTLEVVEIAATDLKPGAIQSLPQLAGAEFIQAFAATQQITTGGVQLDNRTFEIPAGFEAIAIQIDFVAGGAGYVNPGDRINLYGVYAADPPLGDLPLPRAELLLTNVEVLDVDLSIAPRRGSAPASSTQTATQRATGTTVTYLLALRTNDAEKAIYTTEFASFYATLTADDAPPSGPSEGRHTVNVLGEEPNDAFNR